MRKIIAIAATLILSSGALSAQRLIVRMDDIGASHAENLAIIKCYQEGIGRSAEIMPVCPWFLEAATMLNENPGLDVGVHVALRSEWIGYKWRPITNCPSLCDEDGYMNFNFGGKADLKEIEAEIRAQIELALKYVKNVTHITDHCMWTMIMPELGEMAKRIAADYGLRYQGSGDEEIGIFNLPVGYGGEGSYEDRLLEGIKKMEKGKTYWTIEHPGLDNEEMKGIYEIGRDGKRTNVGRDRQAVTDAFTSPKIMQYIKENGIELVSFGDVMREYKVIKK